MKLRESMYLEEIKIIDEALSLCKPPPHTLSTLITCITKPLFSHGINGLNDLTNCSGTHIFLGTAPAKASENARQHSID